MQRFISSFILCGGLLLAAAPAPALRAQDKPPRESSAKEPPELTAEAKAVAERLERALPADSEAREMYVDILKGSRLGLTDGWFRKAVSQTRFTWKDVAGRYDANKDGEIGRQEFPGSDADFARLDRNRDARLTGADLDFSEHALNRTPGAMLFHQADADGNGKVTSKEFQQLFAELGGDEEEGYLSLDDLSGRFGPPDPAAQRGRRDRPSVATLLKGLERQEIGSLQSGPALNEQAPDFTLKTADGKAAVTLSQRVGDKPVVLVFGNFTCGPFRSQAGNVEKLHQRYKDRADFLMVYVREAHPTDGWWMESNNRVGIEIPQPATDAERTAVAQRCSKHLALSVPLLVDAIDDRVGAAYSGMPSRLYLLDKEGRIAFKSGRGPFGFKPAELEQALVLLLAEE